MTSGEKSDTQETETRKPEEWVIVTDEKKVNTLLLQQPNEWEQLMVWDDLWDWPEAQQIGQWLNN